MKSVFLLLIFVMVVLTDGFIYSPPFHQTGRTRQPDYSKLRELIAVPWKILSVRPMDPMKIAEDNNALKSENYQLKAENERLRMIIRRYGVISKSAKPGN